MNKSEKNFDAGLRVLEVLKVLLNENLKKIDLIEKLKSNAVVECVYTQEAFVKYFNTLEAMGFELERVKNQYILLNPPCFQVQYYKVLLLLLRVFPQRHL